MKGRTKSGKCLLLPLLIVLVGQTFAQAPCTDQEALQKSGTFTLDKAEEADLDRRLQVKPSPEELKNTERAAELVKQSIAGFRGLDAKYWHDFLHGDLTGRLLKYSQFVSFFDYYCVPMHGYGSEFAGKIRIADETGTAIHISFNTLAEFVGELQSLGKEMKEANGRMIFELPPEAGEWKGHRLYELNQNGERSEAIMLTSGGRFPFKPVSRDQFLTAREKAMQVQIDDARSKPGLNAQLVAGMENHLQEFRTYHASMSPAELQSQAIVIEWSGDANRGRIFAKDAQHGKRLVVVDPDFIDKRKPRTSVQLIVLYWRWEDGVPAKREMIERFKQSIDVTGLERMLTQ